MAAQLARAPRVFIDTLGCAKNETDSRQMAERLKGAGAQLTDDAQMSDVIIVNTCSFIRQATEESIEAVLDALGVKGEGGRAPQVIVAGCMPARYGEELEASIPEAASFLPCSQEDDIVEAVCTLTGWVPEAKDAQERAFAPFAYLKISDGCDRWCSFCTIPQIRGRYHSFLFEDILAEARGLAQTGARELVLIGQDTGIWGHDLPEGHDLAWLLGHLADDLPHVRFRVMYTEPEGITDALLDVMATRSNVCRYLDIPLQHVSSHVLAAMRRSGSAEAFRELVGRIRAQVPDVTLRTTLMCGFPGETEEQFEELLEFIREALFDYVGVFAYSQEEGTKAALMEGQIPEDVKEMRARELRDEADSVSAALVAARAGARMRVLVEGAEEDGQLYGRADCQAPEVDGVTYVDAGKPGQLVEALIEDALLYDMEGTVL